MIDRRHDLPVTRQVELLDLACSSVYYVPKPVSDGDLRLMRRIDELHLNHPFAGARMLRDLLRLEGIEVGRKHVGTLMKKMGIEALYRKRNTSRRNQAHRIYPYLLRDLTITCPNQVWAMGTTYKSDVAWFCLSDGGSRLGNSACSGLALIEHTERRSVCRGARRSPSQVRRAADHEHRPGQPIHQ